MSFRLLSACSLHQEVGEGVQPQSAVTPWALELGRAELEGGTAKGRGCSSPQHSFLKVKGWERGCNRARDSLWRAAGGVLGQISSSSGQPGLEDGVRAVSPGHACVQPRTVLLLKQNYSNST